MPKVVRFHRTGDASVLQLDDLPRPEPGPGDVVIDVAAFGLNRAEIMFREGNYPQYAPELPSTIGYEAAGVVAAVGKDVASVAVGDKVSTVPSFKMGPYWTYGEVALVPEHAVAAYPDRLTPAEATAIWMPYMTVYGALIHQAKVSSGDHVIITAASSSVGVAAIQMVNAVGGITIATTRGANKRDFIRAQGADHVIVTDDENLADRILEITSGKGAEYVFDPVAGPQVAELARAIAYQGTVFVYGRLDPKPTPFPVNYGLSKGLTLKGYSLFEVINFPDIYKRGIAYVTEGLARGDFNPVVDRTFPLEQVADAHRHMESNTQTGKIVVVTSPS
jgi:NADPH:quinone reductase-like Zn-dependent oxidoreductase